MDMPKPDESTDKAGKTGVLMTLGNLILSPLYYADSKWGLAASAALSSAAVYKLHEIGKEKRLGANTAHKAAKFFGAKTDDVGNAFDNVIEGGAAVFDALAPSKSS